MEITCIKALQITLLSNHNKMTTKHAPRNTNCQNNPPHNMRQTKSLGGKNKTKKPELNIS